MNRVRSVMLMTLLGLILVSAGGYVGGQNGATMMFIIALILNFYSYWNSDKIVLKAYNAKELSENQVPELFSLVKGLSRNAGIPMPRLYIIPTEIPNAFATGRNENHAAVAVTEGLISLLDRDEIAGVIGHELSHIRHHDTLIMTLAATFATAISYLAQAAQWAAIFGSGRDSEGRSNNPFALIATIIIAPLAASLVQMALSRSREFMADASGAEISGKPLALAVHYRNWTVIHVKKLCLMQNRLPPDYLLSIRLRLLAVMQHCFLRILLQRSVLKSCMK